MMGRILVVQNNEANRVLVRDVLKLMGGAVWEVSNGQEGNEWARKRKAESYSDGRSTSWNGRHNCHPDIKVRLIGERYPVTAVTSYFFEDKKRRF